MRKHIKVHGHHRKAHHVHAHMRVVHQTGTTHRAIDKQRKAKRAGWRRSKSGKRYYEARRNRSDVNPVLRL